MKDVLVTGAASGIGKATSYRFAQTGRWNVISVDKNEFGLEHDRITEYICDVTERSSLDDLESNLENINIDCLVNNAGISIYGPIEDVEIEEMVSVYDVNVFGIKRMFDIFSEDIIENNGTVVNISSLQAQFGTAGFGVYSSSKHAVRGLTDAMRNELKPMDVDVVLIEPGSVNTSLKDKHKQREFSRSQYNKLIGEDEDFNSDSIFVVEPIRVADYVVKSAETYNPKNRYRVGWDSRVTALIERLPTSLKDKIYKIIG